MSFFAGRCNKIVTCSDSSDELDCSCKQNEFKCHCYASNPVTCPRRKGCIPSDKVNDGITDCPDDSDENRYRAQGHCNKCYVTLKRFQNKTQCQPNTNFDCDITTCYSAPSIDENLQNGVLNDVICSNASKCPNDDNHEICARTFHCKDDGLALAIQFCDGRIDCLDGSDETRHRPGFKCVGSRGTCVLPQINLYDDVAQCDDQSDLCFSVNGSCFQCLDKRLWISSKQVCDGSSDCFDSSDEILCENVITSYTGDLNSILLQCDRKTLNNNMILMTSYQKPNINFIQCQTKYGQTTATLCDGQPECRDFSDECNCKNPPRFCNDTCHLFYPLGDRYCDGYEDEAWKYINNSNCSKGFDERFCPDRFRCKAGDRVSINVKQKCNGMNDCDDGADETNCPEAAEYAIFSSNSEMIDSVWLRSVFWIMGFFVIGGNCFVIIKTTPDLKHLKSRNSKYCFQIMVLNISIADFIMGIYLIIIAAYSAAFSGTYKLFDLAWRSSLRCSIIGSLAIISSETSCFLMVILTSYRLYSVYFPVKSFQSLSRFRLHFYICFAWLTAALLAILPISHRISQYFARDVWFVADRFTVSHIWSKRNVALFTCRLSQLTNITLQLKNSTWDVVEEYLKLNFPQYAPQGQFGYYGETSVCLPRFFVNYGDYAWEYTLIIITINLVSFVFIAVAYCLIIVKVKKQNSLINKNNEVLKQEKRTQARIARIILTDMLCWIPICLMTYAKLAGGNVSSVAYIVSAGLLLPINSAFNPFLLSSLPEKILEVIVSWRNKLTGTIVQTVPVTRLTLKSTNPMQPKYTDTLI